MRKLINIALFALFTGFIGTAYAQEKESTVKKDAKAVKATTKKDAKAVKTTTKKDAKAVGNKTAELSSKAKSKIVDKTYADKTGPGGQTIYIDKHAKYYWVNSKGHKVYEPKTALKDKVK